MKKKVGIVVLIIGLLLLGTSSFILLTAKKVEKNKPEEVEEEDEIIYESFERGVSSTGAFMVDGGDSYIVATHNVVNYGADPKGETDSTKAFKDALQAARECAAAGKICGTTVYVPAGTYLVTEPLYIYYYSGLIGSKNYKTVINYKPKGDNIGKPFIQIEGLSAIKNIVFHYPNQKVDKDGNGIKAYGPTIQFVNGYGLTLENLRFINSYVAIDLSGHDVTIKNSSIFFLSNISGTPLKTGIINDGNLDTIRIDNVNFNPSYWSKFDNINKDYITKALKNERTKAAGIELERVDWAFLAKINIQGYHTGLRLTNSIRSRKEQPDFTLVNGKPARTSTDTEGELYDSTIKDCTYPVDIINSRHFAITSSVLSSTKGIALNIHNNGSKGSTTGIYDEYDVVTNYSIYDTQISSTGNYSISHGGHGAITITNSKVSGKINKQYSDSIVSVVGTKLSKTGLDNCSISGTLTYTKPTDYTKKVTNKPTSKTIKVIKAKVNDDITKDLKEAISSLTKGGIVYIPNGRYKVSETINVTKGIEIRGGTSWIHNGTLIRHNGLGSTQLVVDKSITVFNLSANSGIDGLEIVVDSKIDTKPTNNFIISGTGANIYVKNVSLPGVYNGIKINGNNHYIEHIWGAFYHTGIEVSGNTGNIRSIHISKNAIYDVDKKMKIAAGKEDEYRKHQTVVVKSSNETLYSLFVFAPRVAYTFNGATNFKAIGIGSDATKEIGINVINSNGTVVNSMIVATLKNASEKNMPKYIVTQDITKTVEFINSIHWSNTQGIYLINGKGDVHIYGGILEKYPSTHAIVSNNPRMTIAGLIFKLGNKSTKLELNKGVTEVNMLGNVCPDGKCASYVKNNANAKVGVQEPKSNCTTPITEAPEHWDNLTLKNTSATRKTGNTTICNLGSTYTQFVYSTKTDKEKTAKISKGCATITITPGKDQVLYYKLKNKTKTTSKYTVKYIGKYLIFAQEYNYLLYENKPVSNDVNNLGYWVTRPTDVTISIKSIAATAIKNKASASNEAFVKAAYKGIFGRDVDASGQTTWVNYLKTNSREQLIERYLNIDEAKNIYSTWGYK